MRHLIDTQILIWTVISPDKLSKKTEKNIGKQRYFRQPNHILEIAIKQKIGKLPQLNMPISALSKRVEKDGFNLLFLETRHIAAYEDIPLLTTHRDPFDRILLATALSENIPIISSDTNFEFYLLPFHSNIR